MCAFYDLGLEENKSGSVLLRKPLHQHKIPKRNATTQKRHRKIRLHNDWLRTVSWNDISHPTSVVKLV